MPERRNRSEGAVQKVALVVAELMKKPRTLEELQDEVDVTRDVALRAVRALHEEGVIYVSGFRRYGLRRFGPPQAVWSVQPSVCFHKDAVKGPDEKQEGEPRSEV